MLIPSGNIRLEYLNNTAYLMHEDYGWFVSGVPTHKLKSLLEESDRITKDRWIAAKPNDSFVAIDDTPLFDVTIPTYWNLSGEYPKSNGIGFGDDLVLRSIIQAEDEYSAYIPKETMLDQSKHTTDVPNERLSSFLPQMDPGFFFAGDSKSYIYPNKVTKIIKTTAQNSMYLTETDDIDSIHPVYIAQLAVDFDDLKSVLKNYTEESDDIIIIESKSANHNEEGTVSGLAQPYTPILTVVDDSVAQVPKSNTSYNEHLVIDNTETNIPKETTYINLDYSFLNIENPIDGVAVITYNKKDDDYVVPHNVDLSPITWDSSSRVLSIVSGNPTPYTSTIYMPIKRVNNTESTIPVTINVRDTNGVPVSGLIIRSSDVYTVKDLAGTTQVQTIEDVSGQPGMKVLKNLISSKEIVLNDNRTIGRTKKSADHLFFEKPPEIDPSGVTNEYGSAYLDIKVQPYLEPVSTLRFYYGLEAIGESLSGETVIQLEIEQGDMLAGVDALSAGEYTRDVYIPKLYPHRVLCSLDYEDFPVSGWIYGHRVQAFDKWEWLGGKTIFTALDSVPSGDMSVIKSSSLSGEYMLVYDEVESTCL